jgi:hypothetical protein
MTTSFRDVELLSAYLDGGLSPSESARLESRLQSDPELAAVLNDLRQARGLLRQLPRRRAPRNFTLTPRMVGLKPPMPRAYNPFRFASAFAALLLLFTIAVNSLSPRMTFGAAAPLPYGGVGGGCGEPCGNAPADQAEAPAATEAPALEPSMEMQVAPTAMPTPVEEGFRVAETPQAKMGELESVAPTQPEARAQPLVPLAWQVGLAVLGLACAGIAFGQRVSARRKWQK